jgi:hypothetical protein
MCGLRRNGPVVALRALVIAVMALVSWCTVARAADAFRPIVASTVSFSSDGIRFVAWEVQNGGPLVVMDADTGRRREVEPPTGCDLAGEEGRGKLGRPAAAGRFLLKCGTRDALLDARTAAVKLLPSDARADVGWYAVGQRYVEGLANQGSCAQSRAEITEGTFCLALYSMNTGRVGFRPQSRLPDLDGSGAPPICRALRSRIVAQHAGVGERLFTYGDEYFAHQGARRGAVRVDRCHGRSIVLHSSGEPVDFDVRGGLLTWDTGHEASNYFDESGGTLTAYSLSSGRRRHWNLPRQALDIGIGQRATGVFGYATHTASRVFWIASRSLSCGTGECRVETSSVYSTALR